MPPTLIFVKLTSLYIYSRMFLHLSNDKHESFEFREMLTNLSSEHLIIHVAEKCTVVTCVSSAFNTWSVIRWKQMMIDTADTQWWDTHLHKTFILYHGRYLGLMFFKTILHKVSSSLKSMATQAVFSVTYSHQAGMCTPCLPACPAVGHGRFLVL